MGGWGRVVPNLYKSLFLWHGSTYLFWKQFSLFLPLKIRRTSGGLPPLHETGTTNSGACSHPRPRYQKFVNIVFAIEWYFNVYYLRSFDSLQYDLLNEFQHLLRFKMVELLAKTFNETVQIMKCEARRRSWGERLTFERWQQACVLGLGHLPPSSSPFSTTSHVYLSLASCRSTWKTL